jgi:hypothetical protein
MPKNKREGVDYETIGRHISGKGTMDDAISCEVSVQHFKTLDANTWESIRTDISDLRSWIPSVKKQKKDELKKKYKDTFTFVDKLKKDYRYPISALMASMGHTSFDRVHIVDNTKKCCDVFVKASCWCSPKDEEVLKFRDIVLSTLRFKKSNWEIKIWDAPNYGSKETDPPTFRITDSKILKRMDGKYTELIEKNGKLEQLV